MKNKKELRKPRSFFLGFFVSRDNLDQFWDLAGKKTGQSDLDSSLKISQ
ncbi:conserved domain protein [Peptoniphilus sp. oral taxon 375 str. F0436]|nr:conserved domain protein [Peptoniphilus sp. oral taxon 375 str. F0436]